MVTTFNKALWKQNNKIKVIKTSEVEKTYDNIIVKLQE
jgi:hypothetical protein